MRTDVDKVYLLSASIIFFALLSVLFLPFIESGNASCPLSQHSFQHTGYIASATSVSNNLLRSCGISQPPLSGDFIANGSFENNTDNWSFVTVAGAPMGSWDSTGYDNGGCAKICNKMCGGKDGEGYWEQTIFTTIEAGSTIELSYAWKKGYKKRTPCRQNIYITIVKPDATTVNIDSQLGRPSAYNTWYTVSEKDVSAFFDQTGTYKIRLRYDYKTGCDLRAQAFAWFDEVKLFVTPPRSVEVSISPDYQSGEPCTVLDYTVTVKNTGNVDDIYDLSWVDNVSWGNNIWLEDNSLWAVRCGGENSTTLHVQVPEGVEGCTKDNITVTATSQSDSTASDSDSCIAHVAIVLGVEVSISPPENGTEPCNWLEYTATVTNTGNVDDAYDLTVVDSANWGPALDSSTLSIPAGENQTATLSVHIPENAIGYTQDNITVTATGTEVENSSSCIARAEIVRSVEVSILPDCQENLSGETLEYEVIITNTGNVGDNYNLTAHNNENWALSIASSITVPAFENQKTMLTVTIHVEAMGCTRDNITITATSQADNTVKDNDSCIAHAAITRSIDVSISPDYQSGPPGATLSYIVTVTNAGNVSDTYTLENSDDAGWSLDLDEVSLTIPAGENRTTTLSVVIPENATPCTADNVTVTATSSENTVVSDNASCVAHPMIQALLGQPTLYLPANGSKTNDNTPTFEWTCGENAYSHHLLVDKDSSFSSPEENQLLGSTDNTYTVTTPLADDNYFWKVVAINEDGSNESDVWSFVIDTISPSAPTLLSPENNATTADNTPTFRWTEPETPENYALIIDNNADFGSPTQIISNITDNTYTLTVELAVDNYYWRVRAIDEAGNAGDWAEDFKLTILEEEAPPRLPSKPQLYSPSNGSKVSTLTPTLRWENGLYAEDHRVLVDIDNNPDDDPLYDHIVEGDNKWTTPSLNDNTTYWWKVIAQNENGENHSITWHFTVETGVPPPQPSAPPSTRWPFVVGATAAVIAGITAALYRKHIKNLRRTVLRRSSSGK